MAPGEYAMDAHGNRLVLSEDAATAQALPSGAKLVKADITVDPAFVAFLQMSAEDVKRSTPETGNFDISATTQPHTAVAGQTQANAPIAFLKTQQMLAVRTMLRNIARTESRSGESLVVLAKVKDGKIEPDSVVEVTAKEIVGLDIDVSTNLNSGAQEVAVSEYYRGMLNDEKVPFGPREYLAKIGEEHPEEKLEAWIAEKAEFAATERIVQQELARRFGDVFVLTPGGGVVNWQGQGTDPMAVLASQGVRPAPQPQGPPGVGAAGMAPLPPQVPQLQPLQGGMNGQGGGLA
jgi:hypothetical protein